MLETVKASLKLLLIALWIMLCYPVCWLAIKFNKLRLRDFIAKLFNRVLLKIIGVKVTVSGEISETRPLLLASNHTSYLDIPVLASQVACSFTPKSEIDSWPVIGGIARLSGAVFVDRRPEKVSEMKQKMQNALAAGRIISLFPEATTGNGLRLLPFKSSFFSLAEEEIGGKQLTVQPVSITYTHIHGLPIDSYQWPLLAWYSDMELKPHAWQLFKLGQIRAELSFLEPVTMQQIGDRKKMASYCHKVIAEQIQALKTAN